MCHVAYGFFPVSLFHHFCTDHVSNRTQRAVCTAVRITAIPGIVYCFQEEIKNAGARGPAALHFRHTHHARTTHLYHV